MSVNKNWLVKQGLFLTIISILASALSFFKEAIFANYFGVSSIADAYTIAIQVPEVLFAVVWESIGTIVIPLYSKKLNENGKAGAQNFLSNIICIVCIISLIFIFFGELLANEIVLIFSPGISYETRILAVNLMRWIFPMLFFEGIIRVCTGILNIHNQFVIPKILITLRNIGVIIFLILFYNQFGVYAAAYGILTGIIIECILCLLSTKKFEDIRIFIDLKDPALRLAIKMTAPLILGIGAKEINQMADKVIASFLVPGTIASLNYASKLSSIIEVVLFSNVVWLLYPTFSSLAAKENKEELIKIFQKSLKLCVLFCLPVIFGGVVLRNEIVSIAFERGSFDYNSVLYVSSLFALYLISTLFTTINALTIKLFSACCDTKTASINSMIGVLINIFLNVILAYSFGAIGLALATLLSSVIISLRMLFLASKKIYKFSINNILKSVLKSIISAMIMSIIIIISTTLVFSNIGHSGFLVKTMYCLFSVILGSITYFIMLIFLKVEEVNDFRKMLINKRNK